MAGVNEVRLYTDGACSVNPGRGGWAAILKFGDHKKILSGGAELTTNNRMELMGVIEGLKALKRPSNVTITTDSKYVADGYSKGWVFNWLKKPGFAGKKNPDLWKELVELGKLHKLTFVWVKGHLGHPENEECDKLAVLVYKTAESLPIDQGYLNQI